MSHVEAAATPKPPSAPRKPLRKWLARGGIAIVALLALVLLALYWLLQTASGRDAALAQVSKRLPGGIALTWSKAEGTLAGPLTLHDLDFRYDDIHFTAARVQLDPRLAPLLWGRLRLDTLQISNARLELGPSPDTPFELPRWPDVLPALDLPLAMRVDNIAIDGLRIVKADMPAIDITRVRGGAQAAHGLLRIDQLEVGSSLGDFHIDGHYLPRRDYQTQLTVRALMPPRPGQLPARVGLVALGDLAHMEVAVTAYAPQPLRARLVMDGRRDPLWNVSARGEQLQLGQLVPAAFMADAPAPLALDFTAHGRGGQAQLQGRVRQGEMELTLAPSNLSIDHQVLSVAPLAVEAFGGSVRVQGTADLSDAQTPVFHFNALASGLHWTPAADPATPVALKQAQLDVSGNLKSWAVTGKADVARAGQSANVDFDVRGSDAQASIQRFKATTPGGRLELAGSAAWSPQLAWDVNATLAGFDPGYFLPGWEGNLSGALTSSGKQLPGNELCLQATLDVPQLHGQLRGRELDARAQLALQGAQGQGQAHLVVGQSHIEASGKVGDTLDVAARLEPLLLPDLLPGAGGTLSGAVQVRGTPAQPDITADLNGQSLQWNDWKAAQLRINGHLPWHGDGGALQVQASALDVGALLDQVNLTARGSVQDVQLDADMRGSALGALALSGNARQNGGQWSGGLALLRLAPAKGAAWQLQKAADFNVRGDRFTLGETCLGADGGGTLCVSADWPHEGVNLRGQALPLALLQPWLDAGRPIYLRGELAIDGQLRPQGAGWAGSVKVTSREGGARMRETPRSDGSARGELVSYDHFAITLDMQPDGINGHLAIGMQGNGAIDATLQTGWEPHAPLTGEIALNMSRLNWLELFSPDLVRPDGLLEGHLSLRGTLAQPSLGGEAKLSNFSGELPALGLTLSEGAGSLVAQPDGSARITASTKTGGEGVLQVDGGLSWFGDAQPLRLRIFGDKVLLSNTSELRVVANPDLDFTLAAEAMELRGSVQVPQATLDLERLDQGTSVSEDVVVLDPVDPEETPSSPLDMDLTISLGDQVKMSGFGLKGALSGKMQVRARPGHETTANGALQVDGRYKAYGQDLTITQGQLSWNNTIVSDPRIAIKAQREIGDVTAGINVTGRAQQPYVEVWSDPAMSQSEALSYLVLGRSLSMASSDQAQQVNAAQAALSAGSGLLAAQVGAKIGLDDAGVSQSRALGGAVIGVGKYITPKLYLGYGVSLVGSGSVITLKYLLRRGFDVEVESSTVENRGSVNWSRER